MNRFVRRYFVDAMGAMAQGLFASLLAGTIVRTVGQQLLRLSENSIFNFFVFAGNFACDANVVGAAMAVGIGIALKVPRLTLFSLATVGAAANVCGGAGGPLAVLIGAILSGEVGNLVGGKTKIDILLTPLITILFGMFLVFVLARPIGAAASAFGNLIVWATTLRPFLMGVIISVFVGILLTLPVSSAAICAALGLTGLAGGAALAGCCAQMVGFAVMSFRENKWGGLFAQGLGTSMLQMPNIIKNPRIWFAPIITSAITGPLSTCVFKIEMNGAAVSSGMGTCGLVGQIGVITGWFEPSEVAILHGATPILPGIPEWIALFLISFILPAIFSQVFCIFFRKIGWIKQGDLLLV